MQTNQLPYYDDSVSLSGCCPRFNPDEDMATLSGEYLTAVFEGPYSEALYWHDDMKATAKAQGKTAVQNRQIGVVLLYDLPEMRQSLWQELRDWRGRDLGRPRS